MSKFCLIVCSLSLVAFLVSAQLTRPVSLPISFPRFKCNSVIGKCPRDGNHHWTQWFDEDTPPTDDREFFWSIKRKYGICPRNRFRATAVDVRTVLGNHPYSHHGNVLYVGLYGLFCYDRNQPRNCPCQDYKIRFCCVGPPPKYDGIVGHCRGGSWSSWSDNDDPGTLPGDSGDTELRFPWNSCVCGRNNPIGIQVYTTPGNQPYELSGNLVHIDINSGFYCANAEQPGKRCKDFKVRYCCPRIRRPSFTSQCRAPSGRPRVDTRATEDIESMFKQHAAPEPPQLSSQEFAELTA